MINPLKVNSLVFFFLSVSIIDDARSSNDSFGQTTTSFVEFIWSGGVTSNSATVNARISFVSDSVRLLVSTSPSFDAPLLSDYYSANTENHRVVSISIRDLQPSTRYYYAIEANGSVDTVMTGRFLTFPDGPSSFKIALGADARSGSAHPIFLTIRDLDPLLFLHMGDLFYADIAENNRTRFRDAYRLVLNSRTQSALYRSVPIAFIWDDHDYGPNDSDSTAPGREASRLTYQEYVPHYPLHAGSGDVPIYQTFSIGRVYFIMTDLRSVRSPNSDFDDADKSMMGSIQKEWFKQQLLDASDEYPLIIWVSSVGWIGTGQAGGDSWYGFTTERRELANFINDHNITGLAMVSADAHMLAIDDGTNSFYADGVGTGFPIFAAAPLDQRNSIKGGPFTHGPVIESEHQFGVMTVTDDGGDEIMVEWSGRNAENEELLYHSFVINVNKWQESDRADLFHNRLFQSYPNPFNITTTIPFSLQNESHAYLAVFDVTGRKIDTIVDSHMAAGMHRLSYDAAHLPSGVFFYRLRVNEYIDTRSFILIR